MLPPTISSMGYLRKKFAESPEFARLAPFGIFLVFTFLQDTLGGSYDYWLYLVKSLVGAWLIWEMRPFVKEMRWAFSWEAVVVGIVIFGAWVGMEGWYPRSNPGEGWNPHQQFGHNSTAAWVCIIGRILGSSLVVPPLEEVVYRSFLYRYFIKVKFDSLPLNYWHALSFVVTSTLFGLMHPDRWLPGIICGLAYQWLVIRKNRLGDAMLAHGITNFLLGLWVVWRPAWNFW